MTSRRNTKLKSAHKSSRRTQHETLERRELLAAELEAPRLIAVSANSGEQFDLQDNTVLSTAPTELKFRFGGDLIDAATLAGIQFKRAGGDGSFTPDANEAAAGLPGYQVVTPGFLGFEDDDGTNIIVARFAETLPDDQYVAELAGFDDSNQQIVGLRDVDGDLLHTVGATDPVRPIQTVRFEVEVGPRVVSVVPQPVENINGTLTQQRNQVFVYFNDDPLSNPLAGPISSATSSLPVVNPSFYKLIYTGETVENTDDLVTAPSSIVYEPLLNRARLTFPGNDLVDLLPPDANGDPIVGGTFRLRVGRGDSLPLAPQELASGGGGADTFDAAMPLGTTFGAGTQSVVVTEGLIKASNPIIPDWPGAYDAPGLRDQRRDAQQNGQSDTTVGINIFPYNFARIYGIDPQFNRLENAITEAQKQRVREVLDLYSERLGVEFVETTDAGLQIVTGDIRAIVQTADTGAGADTPLSLYRVNERDQSKGLLVLDAGENWYDGYGFSPDNRLSYFQEALRGVGDLLGIGNLFELAPGVAAGGSSPDEPNSVLFSDQYLPNLPVEPEFLSQSDITIGQALHRPESNDVDFYSFTATETGQISIETIAERLDGSSLLDTHLKLYRVIDAAADQYELVAQNDDFFSEDSFIGLEIAAGDYIVGVSASGNDQYNGLISGSGLGGTSEGTYELRMTFKSSVGQTITDSNGTQLDGDADGVAGGEFNFWFRVAPTVTNATAGQPRTIFVEKVTGDDGVDINGNPVNDGSLQRPKRTIAAALRLARPGDVVRILPNGGVDGLIHTQQDNLAYEIGIGGSSNSALSDGSEFVVPKGVTVMIDAGSLFKMKDAKVSVGSETVDEDRSLAALQILGTPVIAGETGGTGEVFFTSWDDESLGVDTNPLPTTAQPGQWAGIEFRNDFDYSEGRPVWETEGIFLDFVSHANIQYGGGSISSNDPIVTPIQMNESRPTLIYNTIRNSADAAISADPNSFLETNFNAPVYQRAQRFTSDYDRVGPEISGNRLINNSINGLFVRVETPAAGELEPMTVSGRFDDQDIVHVLSQVLVLQGQPGGAILLEDRPDVLSVSPTLRADGTLVENVAYDYRITYVTAAGNESLSSLPTASIVTSSTSKTIRLANLPTTPPEFVGRRLYRSIPGSTNYEFVTQLDRVTTGYTDNGSARGGLLREQIRPDASGVTTTAGAGGSLIAGTAYDYRLTFFNALDGETQASDSTASFVAPASGSIELAGLPAVPDGFVGLRIYRSIPGGSQYELIDQLIAGETSYVDEGREIDLPQRILRNDGNNGTLFLPRFDARLSIDPGLVIKLQNARIEAGFGADFYAEGEDGKEIIFTSRRDDSYGAGGTFDTNNDAIADNAAPGDWGGLVFRQDASGSLDFAEVRFGGGSTAIDGQFTEFNAIEILQADVRIANSTITDNDSGFAAASTRGGIGFNDEAAIFVRGSQPVLVGNTIEGNIGAAISINPNALNADPMLDYGRSTGGVGIFTVDMDNQGPVIAGNRLDDNTINAVRVRSEVLTTDSVWDDTDIVHVVEGEIASATHHYRGALRLKSDPNQSLVVKFGPGAELVGTGRPLDIEDRIGGTVQVLGTPGNPVVLTSWNDSTVGAGFTPDGEPMNCTLSALQCEDIIVETDVPYVDVVVVMDESVSMGFVQDFSEQFIVDLEAGLTAAGIGVSAGNRYGAVGFGRSGAGQLGRSLLVGGNLFGSATDYAVAAQNFVTAGSAEDGFAGIDFTLQNYAFRPDAAKFIILATDEPRTNLVQSLTQASTIQSLRSADVAVQGILGVSIQTDGGVRALAIDNEDVYVETGNSFVTEPGGQITFGASLADYVPLVQATDGITGDLSQIGRSTQTAQVFGDALISSIIGQAGGSQADRGAPGDWLGLRLESYINDRNVAYVLEQETADPASIATNAFADNAQIVGDLAGGEFAGDENERLGFNIRGALASPDDVDTYSFTATGGTGVYIDIDETSVGLNTIVELVTANAEEVDGDVEVLARSDDSFREANDRSLLFSALPDGTVQPLYQLGTGNVESANPYDAGMRVILPGSNSSENTYYVRVRSDGKSAGSYQLSVRLRETEEVAGSTIQLADIRFATDAITVNSAPLHSPLTGTAGESLNYTATGTPFTQEAANNRLSFTNAQADQLGNLGTSDRGSLVVNGEIGNINSTNANIRLEDVDVYQVDLFNEQLEPDVFDSENRFVTTTFDIDYADGLGRPNTSIAVYDAAGRLILHSRDSNIADDRGRPLNGVDSANLNGGSAGSLDAYIGPVELPEGTYFVAVSNAAVVPSDLDQFFNPTAANTDVRLMPINSTRRLVDDSLDLYNPLFIPADSESFALLDQTNYSAERPIIEPAFDVESIVPYSLDDMRLFISVDSGITGTNQSSLVSVNPVTGVVERLIGQSSQPTGDIAARTDGELFSYTVGPPAGTAPDDGNIGGYENISPVDGSVLSSSDDGIVFSRTNQAGNGMEGDDPAQLIVEAMAFPLSDRGGPTGTITTNALNNNGQGFLVGYRDTLGRGEIPIELTRNILYSFRQVTGEITTFGSLNANADRTFPAQAPYSTRFGPASDEREYGIIDTGNIFPTGGDGGDITGLANFPNSSFQFYAATDQGGIHSFDYTDTVDAPRTSPAFGYGSVIPTTFHGVVQKDPAHAAVSGNFPPSFSGLALGPRTIEDGAFRETMFLTTDDGWLYAVNLDEDGRVQPARVLNNGRSAIQLSYSSGIVGVGSQPTGLAFGNLEASPWHYTTDRNLDDGHGIKDNYDNSRAEFSTRGGGSLYYGFEVNPGTNNGGNNPQGNTISRADDSNLGELAPGGSHGTIVSRPINLEGYSAADKPTLYFSYFMEVEADDDYRPNRLQRDSFRVFAAGDDGEWKLLATNNDFRQLPSLDEYDYYNETGIPVQELFDDSNAWRQARVDLSPLAGNENVRLRFDFSTAGGMRPHFDSVELVGIEGDEVVHGQQISFNDELGNQILLENVVGTTVVFPAGADIASGDTITLSSANGNVATLTFVTANAGPGEVEVNASMNASQVAAAVFDAIDRHTRPINLGGGRIRFAAVSTVTSTVQLGLANPNPVLVQRLDPVFNGNTQFDGALQLVIPDGDQIFPGDRIEISDRLFNPLNPTIQDQFTFVETLTGAPNEILYTRTDTADTIARALFALLPLELQPVYEGDGVITLLAEVQAGNSIQFIAATPSPLIQPQSDLNLSRIEVDFSFTTSFANEVYTFKHAEGIDRIVISATPVNIPGVTNVLVDFFASPAEIAAQVALVLPPSAGAYVTPQGELSFSGASVTVASSATTMSLGRVNARTITVPDGTGIRSGETITLVGDDSIVTLTMVQNPAVGPPNSVNYNTTDTAATIISNIVAALGADAETFVSGNELTVLGVSTVMSDDPTTNFSSVGALDYHEIVVPVGNQITDGQTLTVDGRVITFVLNGAPAVDTVPYANNESGAVIAQRLAVVLGSSNPLRRDNPFANTLRVQATTINLSGFNPTASFTTDSYDDTGVLLPLTDLGQLRTGLRIEVDPNGFGIPGFGTTLVFVERGSTIPPSNDVEIYFSRNAFDPAVELQDVYQQIIDALSSGFNPVQVQIDPYGRGLLILDNNAQVILPTPDPTRFTLEDRDVNESAVPISFPSGDRITESTTVTVITKGDPQGAAPIVLSFVTAANATGAFGEIIFDPSASNTPTMVRDMVLSQLPLELQGFQFGSDQILLLDALSVEIQTPSGVPSNIVSYRATTSGVIPILVDSTMDSRAVAERLKIALNEGVAQYVDGGPTQSQTRDFTAYAGDRIRLYNLTPADVGNYGLSGYELFDNGSGALTTSAVPGDEFGLGRPFGFANSEIDTRGASNNEVEGVYIDDIIVGFAERGEMVVESTNGERTFTFNPETLPDTHPQAVQPELQNEILTGPYSLEIRTSDEYGVPQDYFPINLQLGELNSWGRSFDTNDRLTGGAVSLIAPPGLELVDGDFFVINDGWREMTFEFDSTLDRGVAPGHVPVVFDPISTQTSATADSIRNAINSAQVQNVLDITAATSDSFQSAASTSNRVELYGSSAITINPSGGRMIKLDLVDAETSQGRETSRQIPIVDQVTESVQGRIFADELDRSTPSGFIDAARDTVVAIGKIGDAVNSGQPPFNLQDDAVIVASDPGADFDSVRIFLREGETVDIDVDTLGFSRAGEILDLPVITVFNDGEILTEDLFGFSIDRTRQSSLFETSVAPGESSGGAFLQFTAPQTGFFDVVVSSANVFGTQTMTVPEFVTGALLEQSFFGTSAETISISSGTSQVVYEYTTNAQVVAGNVPILINATDTPEMIATKTQNVINATQSAVVRVQADGRFLNIIEIASPVTITHGSTSGFFFGSFISTQTRETDFGEYALTIRPTVYSQPTADPNLPNLFPANPDIPVRDVLMVDYQFGISDQNRVQDQGQLVIASNFITESAGSGVVAVSDTRGQRLVNNGGLAVNPGPDSLPVPGSARLLRNQNSDSLIPGVVISNNVISDSGDAAIHFGGDVNTNGQVPSPVSFGRIVNNTVVNRGSGDGVRISGAASPTVLNNIFSGFTNGIATTANQFGQIVVGGNAFQDNGTNSSVPLATSSFVVPTGVPLFEDPNRGIYIPAAGSAVIDSSFASLPDRSNFLQTVKQPAGISPSPIIAPEFDAYGQPRVDDPLVATPGGVGANVFIDRGAIDRADDVRPTAVLTGPQDAIGFRIDGGDQDRDGSFVRLTEGTLSFFEVQLLDPAGTGIDPDTVTDETVILTENGARLIPGRDYIFGYSSNSNTIRLTPLTGIWRPDAVYEITLNNKQRIEVSLRSGDQIPDGSQIVITETDGTITNFEFEAGYSVVIPETTTLTVDGINLNIIDGETITINDVSGNTRVLEFDKDGSTTAGSIPVDVRSAGTIVQVRDAILAALSSVDPGSNPAETVAQAIGLAPIAVGSDKIQLGTVNGHLVTTTSTAILQSGVDQGVSQGDRLVYSNGINTVTFEFTQNTTSDPTFVPVLFSRTDTPDQIAQALAAAVSTQPIGLGNAAAIDNARVALGGQIGDTAFLTSTAASLQGAPGVSVGAIALPYTQTADFTASIAAARLQSAIRDANLNVQSFNPGGGTLLIEGAVLVDGNFDGVLISIGNNLPPIADLSGNRVRETRINDETRFTIVMPEVEFDFGDAPVSYNTLLANNGARHTVSGDSVTRLGVYLDTEVDGQPSPASDDALLAISFNETGDLFTFQPNTIVVSGAVAGGETLAVTIGSKTVTFEMIRATDNPTGGNEPITFVDGESADSIALKIFQQIRAKFDVIDTSVLINLSGDTISLQPIDDEDGVPVGTYIKDNVPYLVFADDPTITGNLNADNVVGFLNPSDPSGSTIPVFVTGSGLVDIWVDFDGNGTFDADEKIASNEAVSESLNPNPIIIPQSAFPADAVPPGHVQGQKLPDRWMRVRLSQSGDLSPTGVAVGGEVEDYMVSIAPFDPPVPSPDEYTVAEDSTLVIDTSIATPPTLIANDTNLDQLLPVRFFVGRQPANGTLVINPGDELTGSFSYVPNSDFVGQDTFTYRLSTQRNSGSVAANATFATVTINVTPVNDAPGVLDQNLVALEYQPGQTPADQPEVFLASTLLAGATGDGDPMIPGLPFDESNQDAGLRLISITVGGVTIDAANQSAVGTTPRGATVTAEFDTELADPLDPTTFDRTFITRIFYQGADYFNSDNLRADTDPPLLDNFTFTVQDDGRSLDGNGIIVGGTPRTADGVASVRVTPQNTLPTPLPELISISDDSYRNFYLNQGLQVPTPTEDNALLIPSAFLLANDLQGSPQAEDENQGINGNDGNLRITAVSIDPFFGSVALDATTGDVLFTPADDIYGQVEFVYEVEDQGQDEAKDGTRTDNFRRASVTSTIFVEPVNDAPVAYDRNLSVVEAVEPAGPAILSFTANDLIVGRGVVPSPIMTTSNSITVVDGASMVDGQTVVITNSLGKRSVVEFSTSPLRSVGTDVLVTYSASDTAADIAARLQTLLRAAGLGGVNATDRVELTNVTSIATSSYTAVTNASAAGFDVPDGSMVVGGEMIEFTDSRGRTTTLELSTTGVSITGADLLVVVSPADTAATVSSAVKAALLSVGIGGIDNPTPPAGRAGVQFSSTTVAGFTNPSSAITSTVDGLIMADADDLLEGETVILNNSRSGQIRVEFNSSGLPSAGTDILVQFAAGESALVLANRLEASLRGLEVGAISNGDGSVSFRAVASAVEFAPMSSIIASTGLVVFPAGAQLIDGETVSITDGGGNVTVVEFSTSATPSAGTDVLVTYFLTDTATDVATRFRSQLQSSGLGGLVATDTVTLPVVSSVSTTVYTAVSSASGSGISVPDGSTLIGGEVIRLTDQSGATTTVELSTSGISMTGADLLVQFNPADNAATISAAIKAALLAAGIGSVDDPAPNAGRAGLLFNHTSVTGINDPNSQITSSASGMTLPDGAGLINGETITLADGLGGVLTVEFNTTGTPAAGTDVVVQYAAADLAAAIAANLETALRGQGLGVTDNGDGSLSFSDIVAGAVLPPMTSFTVSATEIVAPEANLVVDGERITLTVDGNPVVVEFNTTGIAASGSDYVVSYAYGDSGDLLMANLESLLRADGYAVTADGNTLHLSNSSDIVVTELPDVAGDFDENLPAPYNEIEQSLRVVAFSTNQGTVRVGAGFSGSQTLGTANGGLLTFNFANGIFVSGTYAPPVNYNELPPFAPVDLFTYKIADNGRTRLPVANLIRILPAQESVQQATVTISVKPANDRPFIVNEDQVDVMEDPTAAQATIPDVFTTVLPAPSSAEDELLTQGRPTVTNISVTDVRGVMAQLPDVDDTGALTVYPNADAVGSVVYVFTFTDDHPTNPQSTDVTVTVNVRPVNDAPRFNPSVAGSSAVNNADDAYSVARGVDPNTGAIIDAAITYTLREDNTQPVGDPPRQYFIPLRRDPSVIGYNRVGLLDVFTVGPANEASAAIEGGNQTLDIGQVPPQTVLGGTLTVGVNSSGVPGVFYTPPQDYNNQIGGVDQFTYSVIDDGTTYVNGQLVSDPQSSTNVVRFNLNPVNDKPQFAINLPPADLNDPTGPLQTIEVLEDSAATTIDNFAFDIEAGPPTTAFDEVNFATGQNVRFSVTSLGFPLSQASDFFTEFPSITPDGRLNFRPAPDVFGSFDFEIVLTDDGPGNETRGDLISSDPRTITIDVLPINDPPVIRPNSTPLDFAILEDTSIDVMSIGDGTTPGLLDVFAVGPDNEALNITPGGNQTLTLKEPTPIQSTFGGTVTQIRENGVLTGLRYTPRANFVGIDTFTYSVTDNGITVDFGTDGAERPDPRIASNTVRIQVNPVNNAPQFSGPANVAVSEDAGAVSIANWATNVLAGPPTAIDELSSQAVFFTITRIDGGDPGLFAVDPVAVVDSSNNTAALEFTPAPDANGVATFTAQLFDIPTDGTTQASSSVRTFTLRVNAVNDPPTFDRVDNPITVNEDSGPYSQVWASNISPGPMDESSQTVRFEVATPVDAQSLFQQLPTISDDGILRFIPAANANGSVDLTVTAIDSDGESSAQEVLRLVITAVNDRPTAVTDSVSTDEDSVLTISVAQLLANDIDPDIDNPSDSLTIVLDAESFSLSGARVSYDEATGVITYDPSTSIALQALTEGSSGVDSFNYRVVDSQGALSNIVSVAVTVEGRNDAPVARPDNPTLNPSGPTIIEILANDTDADGVLVPTSIQITLQPAFGSLSIDDQGVVTYTAFQSFALEDVFRYRVADNDGEYSNQALVTIAANAAPIARDDQASTFINETIVINVAANDVDPDAVAGAPNRGLDLTSIQIVDSPFSGDVVPLGDGTIRYIPADGFLGIDSFTYTIADLAGRVSSPGTVQVQVTGSRLQNPDLNPDVNDDGDISPIDALLVINHLARQSSASIPVQDTDVGPPYYDVNGDKLISPLDALAVINELARRQAISGLGEMVEGEQIGDESDSEPVSSAIASDFIDAIAGDDDDEDDRINALDAAFGDLI
ncbi:hypothetical protein Mal15_58010 [Stieleria maiorica]|uniref:GEVED domain-containing protein n=1 Tax=Stieleria maiorica TaxID=2795974 RepID=A0A5B9MKC4_9BACT|nr:tandem-95 repeat protein [Stieleria maiorica]QEG01722.1 hypothetical protein Mal15_58010 [Stieleria maiorica]